MISQTAIALAVALPLFVLLATCAILLLHVRYRHAQDCIDRQVLQLQVLQNERAKLEKQLRAFPKAGDVPRPDFGFGRDELEECFNRFCGAMWDYVDKWIGPRDPSSPSENESATRIELLLFPEPPPESFLNAGKDNRLFPNPHQYTSAEICTLFEHNINCRRISEHILNSIVLKGISIEGNPHLSLLPFGAAEVYALDKLQTLVRGVELFEVLPVHISKFGFHYALKQKPEHPRGGFERLQYIKFFESLFDPYFKPKSPADVTQRRQEFHDHTISVNPALFALMYKHEKLEFAVEVGKPTSVRLW